ncbi:MAG: PAAR domain-containing protein [Polyangiaceae bacterium]
MPAKAAILGTNHTCPMKVNETKVVKHCIGKDTTETTSHDHVGGPIFGVGSKDVKINNKLAARTGDNATCQLNPKVDMITTGAKSVKINNRVAALVGSRTIHKGEVVDVEAGPASKDVVYGGPVGGATFGNSAKATAACREAAKGRSKYKEKDWQGGDIPEKDRNGQQGKQMNCGQESMRTACIQACAEKKLPPDDLKRCCEACKTKEDDWYKRYIAENRERHNAATAEENAQITKRNDDLWKATVEESKDIPTGKYGVTTGPKGTDPQVDISNTWHGNELQRLYFWALAPSTTGSYKKSAIFEKLGELVVDPADKVNADKQLAAGTLGSNAKARAELMKKWCGIDSEFGENTTEGITNDLANGKTVIASVDVGVMAGQDPQGRHAVMVSQIEYNDDGTLKSVTMNDTSRTNACGYEITDPKKLADFQKSLVIGAQTSAY